MSSPTCGDLIIRALASCRRASCMGGTGPVFQAGFGVTRQRSVTIACAPSRSFVHRGPSVLRLVSRETAPAVDNFCGERPLVRIHFRTVRDRVLTERHGGRSIRSRPPYDGGLVIPANRGQRR